MPKVVISGNNYPSVFATNYFFRFQFIQQTAQIAWSDCQKLRHFPLSQGQLKFGLILRRRVTVLSDTPNEILQALTRGEAGDFSNAGSLADYFSAKNLMHRQIKFGIVKQEGQELVFRNAPQATGRSGSGSHRMWLCSNDGRQSN
jgi:hypothetical protein